MLSLLATLLAAPAAPAAPPAQEIVVTARRDKCFVEYGQHPVSDAELDTLSQSWATGTPVRVIEPRGASLKCEFQIMQYLDKHGAHMAEFVKRADDLSPEDEKAADAVAKQEAAAAAATPAPDPVPSLSAPLVPVSATASTAVRSRRRSHPPIAAPGRSVAQAPGGLVTLTCTMADPQKPYQLDVIVNEEKGTVTPSRPDTGGGSEMKAVFMPDVVRFGPFAISRTSLRIQRQTGAAKGPAVVEGQCALADLRRVF